MLFLSFVSWESCLITGDMLWSRRHIGQTLLWIITLFTLSSMEPLSFLKHNSLSSNWTAFFSLSPVRNMMRLSRWPSKKQRSRTSPSPFHHLPWSKYLDAYWRSPSQNTEGRAKDAEMSNEQWTVVLIVYPVLSFWS